LAERGQSEKGRGRKEIPDGLGADGRVIGVKLPDREVSKRRRDILFVDRGERELGEREGVDQKSANRKGTAARPQQAIPRKENIEAYRRSGRREHRLFLGEVAKKGNHLAIMTALGREGLPQGRFRVWVAKHDSRKRTIATLG